MSSYRPESQFSGLPPMENWLRNLLVALLAFWVTELVATNFLRLPTFGLAWFSFERGFQPWQIFTRYLIQGSDVSAFLFSALALYFTLPTLEQMLTRRQLGELAGSVVVGGSIAGLVLDAVGLVDGTAFGWSVFAASAFTALGRALPEAEIRLFFVLPVSGRFIAYGTGAVSLLMLLASRSIGSADFLGAWGGVMLWWSWRGPGARRRQLAAKGKKIEKQLHRLRVVEGGKTDRDVFH